MTPQQRISAEMVALGGCPTAEPHPDMLQSWKLAIARKHYGVEGADEQLAGLRELEREMWLEANPECAQFVREFQEERDADATA